MFFKTGLSLAIGLALTAAPVAAAPTKPNAEVDAAKSPAKDAQSVTAHVANIAGHAYKYKVIAGTLTIAGDDNKPAASMFYVAYILDDARADRPVTFLYNGGPGSSSLWIHMASFGPRRIVLNALDPSGNAPHQIVDNESSLLPETDLVFLDAINTGYSRPLGDKTPESFMSADADIDIFASGIERFLTMQNRWNSPKFLFGESYGTSRSAGLVNRLQKDGVQVNGLIQLGTILNITRALNRSDETYKIEFPTLALTAAYHGKAPRISDQATYIATLKDWVEGPYSRALAKGNALTNTEKAAVARQFAAYTGLSEAFVLRHDLRITPAQFQSELLGDQLKVIGDLDGRFTAKLGTASAEPGFDPSWSFIFRPIVTAWNDYVRNELKFETELPYRRAYPGMFEKFDFRRKGRAEIGQYGSDLAQAMSVNPRLQVYSLNGIYDFSTVFYGADLDYRHLQIPAELTSNIHYFYYGAGHMAYIDDQSRREMTRDIRGVFTDAR